MKWLRRSAQQGYYYAENDLGSRYRTGPRRAAGQWLAYVWLDLAAADAPNPSGRHRQGTRRGWPGDDATGDRPHKELAARCKQSGYKGCE